MPPLYKLQIVGDTKRYIYARGACQEGYFLRDDCMVTLSGANMDPQGGQNGSPETSGDPKEGQNGSLLGTKLLSRSENYHVAEEK